MDDDLTKPPPRAGAAWTTQDDEALVFELSAGTPMAQIAHELGRTEKSIRGRARRMLPYDDPDLPSGEAAFGWLRARLQQHRYDWRSKLSAPTNSAPSIQRSARLGEPWEHAEHDELITELRLGLDWESIAEAHGRSINGVRARAALMVPDDDLDGVSGSRRADRLRELVITRPDIDWLTALRRNSPLSAPLGAEDAKTLREAWETRTPLPDLAASFGLPEFALVRIFQTLGIASTLTEVADRLGCTPGSTVDVRRRFAADPAQTTLIVLVGSDDRSVRHVSLHASLERADEAKRHVTEELATATSWIWSIWKRGIDDPSL